MYRQWRECTKAVIAGKIPKIKKHHRITEEYLQYARRRFVQDPKLAKLYNQNHGIISIREGFLQERGLKGSEIIALESDTQDREISNNVVLVPVASLGCGKTTVAIALTKLFGWGHVQNDNIAKAKNKRQKFVLGITNSLGECRVVIADRNNHMKNERSQIMDDVQEIVPNTTFIALQYVHDPKGTVLPGIRDVTRQRILDRGDNHQTIRAASKNSDEIIGIMEGFLNRFQGVDTERAPDDNFDQVINLDVAASSRENLEKVVTALHANYPRLVERVPTAEELDAAIDSAMRDYQVEQDLSYSYNNQNQNKKGKGNNSNPNQDPPTIAGIHPLIKKLEYFKISLPTQEVSNLLQSLFPPSTPAEQARLYRHLLGGRRIQPTFHVTLIHRASKTDRPEIWDHYTKAYIDNLDRQNQDPNQSTAASTTPTLAPARVRLERLIWNNRLMTFVARILPTDNADDSSADWPCANAIPHITVGTASPQIKPKESNDLLAQWLRVGSGGSTGIWELEVPDVKVVQGSVGVVLSRK